MNVQEFEQRTGLKVTAAEYAEIEKTYMAAGEMDKDRFCACWSQCGNNPLVKELARQARGWEESCGEYADQVSAMEREREELARFLLGKSCAYDDSDFRREAVRLVGDNKAVAMKINMNLPLWDEDREVILNSLV